MQQSYITCMSLKSSVSSLDSCYFQHEIIFIVFSTQRCRNSSLFISNDSFISLQECASCTETVTVALVKVITSVYDCDLFININVSYSYYLNIIFCETEFHICFTIMIDKASE